jgi:hypothetical protein
VKKQLQTAKERNKKLKNKVNSLIDDKKVLQYQRDSLRNLVTKVKTSQRNQLSISAAKVTLLTTKNFQLSKAISKIFTPKQVSVLLEHKKKPKWTNEEIGRAISLRYRSNAYDYMRSLRFPLPSSRTLRRWTSQIVFPPGIMHASINLLKNYFSGTPELDRQCVICFDEMSLDPSYAYDSTEDKVYGWKKEMNVYFVRGLFGSWKQPFAYEFDEKIQTGQFLDKIRILEGIGLQVQAVVNDMGGKNIGLWRNLGVNVLKSSSSAQIDAYKITHCIQNPIREFEKVFFFADAPHIMKKLRDNMLKHGLDINNGHFLQKSDFDRIITSDKEELKSCFKLTPRHLNPKGRELTRVRPALQIFSHTTAAAYKKVFPNRPVQADFIEMMNDWFDLMNSRTIQEAQRKKKPLGMDLAAQMDLLDRVEQAVINFRVLGKKHLYVFQKGMLISIRSTRDIFHQLSGRSLRINYLLTSRLNQDMAENAFSLMRKIGLYHDTLNPVDAKRRLKLIMLSMGGDTFSSSAVACDDKESFLSASMIKSLIQEPEVKSTEENIIHLDSAPRDVNILTEDTVEEVLQSMGTSESLCFGGKEYVAGFVASKLSEKFPHLRASDNEVTLMGSYSWVNLLSRYNLTVPSFEWYNQCQVLSEEFEIFHIMGDQNHINTSFGVLQGFCDALHSKYPQIQPEALNLYIKTRLFIRIKRVNNKIAEDRRKAAEFRMECWRLKLMQQGRDCQRTEEEEEEEEECSSISGDEAMDDEDANEIGRVHNLETIRFQEYLSHECNENNTEVQS